MGRISENSFSSVPDCILIPFMLPMSTVYNFPMELCKEEKKTLVNNIILYFLQLYE